MTLFYGVKAIADRAVAGCGAPELSAPAAGADDEADALCRRRGVLWRDHLQHVARSAVETPTASTPRGVSGRARSAGGLRRIGLGLAPALQRVADEIGVSHPELGEELGLVNAEIRAGVERGQALKNLADRTGLQDIRGLTALLVQTMRFGTSVADALRVYADEFRDKRTQSAEEQAAKISTKMIFPLVLCLFPSFFLVAVGPAVIGLIDAFAGIGR